MGLDMYLNGRKFIWTDWEHPENNVKEDGFELKEKVLELGYWRKHPDLHGYIVQAFAHGNDNCEPIDLGAADIQNIIAAVENDLLPTTSGFFFGASDPSRKDETLEILNGALKWLSTEEKGVSRSVQYRASW